MIAKQYKKGWLATNCMLVLLSLLPSSVFAASGITYQGRLLKPNGDPVLSSVEFKLQIRTPGAEDCLLYEETLTQNLATTSGMFAISLGENPLYRTDSYSANWSMFDALSNRKAFTGFNGADCTGATNYTPSASDNRVFKVSFNDGSQAPGTYENLPVQAINFVPMSVESLAVGGFKASSLLRVEQAGALVNTAPLNNAQYVELLALLAGSSNQYTRDGELNGVALPAIGNNQSVRWNAGAWQAFTPLASETDPTVQAFAKSALPICGAGTVLKSDGTSLSCVADTGGWTAVDATDTVKGIVVVPLTGGLAVTGGSLSLPDQASVTPGSYAKVTVNAKGIVTAHGSLAESDIPTLSTAGKVSGSAITSGTIAGSTAINTTGNIATTGTITTTGALTAGTVSTGRISSSEHRVYDLDASPADNYVAIKVPASILANYDMVLPATQGTSNQILGMNNAATAMEYKSITQGAGVTITHSAGGIQISATGSGGTVTSVTGTANQIDVDNSTPATPVVSLANLAVSPSGTFGSATQVPVVTVDAKGRVTGVVNTTIAATSPVGTALNSGQMWVGSVGNLATAVSMSGDGTLSNTGALKVTAIQNFPVTSTTPTDGQVYRYNGVGTEFRPAHLNVQDIRSVANNAISVFPSTCSASQTMTWSALTDTFVCSAFANTPAGTIAATTVQAAINELDGDVTNLNTNKVNKNGDTMTGTLTVPSLIRTPSSLSGSPVAGEIAIDSADSNKLKWYNGSGWQTVGTSSAAGDIMNGGNTGAITVGTNDATSLTLETSNAARMTVLSDGKVGIGTTAPGSPLEVSGYVTSKEADPRFQTTDVSNSKASDNMTGGLMMRDSANSLAGYLYFETGDTSTDLYLGVDTSATGGLKIQTAGIDRMYVSGAGNVGIGTTNPSTKLDVNGALNVATNIDAGGYVGGNSLQIIKTNATPYNASSASLTTPDGTYGYIWNTSSTDSAAAVFTLATKNSSAKDQAAYIAAVSNPGAAAYTPSIVIGQQTGASAYSERVRIDSNGNVGIGTTAPTRLLQVEGPMHITPSLAPSSPAPAAGDIFIDSTDSNKLKWHNGSTWQTVATGGGTVTSVTGTANEITVGGTASAPVIGLGNLAVSPAGTHGSATQVPVVTVDAKGRVTAVTPTTISGTSPVGSTLNSGQMWVGSVGNLATAVSMSGDGTLSNAGALKVTAIQNFPVTSTTPTDGQVYRYNGVGTEFRPAHLNVQDIRSVANNTISVFPSTCTASQTMTWSALTDTFVCSAFANTPAGNIAAATVQAAINELDTEKVNKNGDTMTGTLVVPSLVRTPASLPGAPAAGEIAIDSADANKMKWYNGSGWQTVGTGAGAGDIVNGGNTGAVTVGTNDATSLTLETNDTPRVTVLSDGKVGIGTSNPLQLLHVHQPAAGMGSFMKLSTVDAGAMSTDGAEFSLSAGASPTLTIHNREGAITLQPNATTSTIRLSGRVNVGGTVSPAARLHQEDGNATATYHKFTAGTTTGSTATDGLDIGLDSAGNAELRQRENLEMRFYTNNAQVMTIQNDGDVGIGTTTPNSKLTVEGGMTLGQLGLDPVGTAGYGSIYAKNDGKLYFRDGVGAITDLTASSGIGDIVNGGNTGAVTVGTNNATAMTLETNDTPRVSILSDGKVGIGTTNPVSALQLNGNISFGSPYPTLDFNSYWNGSKDKFIYTGGAYEISKNDTTNSLEFLSGGYGTAGNDITYTKVLSLDQQAHLLIGPNFTGTGNALVHQDAGNGTATVHKFTAGTTTGQGSTDGFDMGIDASGNAELRQRENLELRMFTNNTQRLTIQNGGNVGIGTTNPVDRLTVAGGYIGLSRSAGQAVGVSLYTNNSQRWNWIVNSTAEGGSNSGSDFQIERYNDVGAWLGTPFLIKRSDGNVGIGTTNPSQKLQVQGNLRVIGSVSNGSQVISGGTNSIDWDNGNTIRTDYDCGSTVNLANLRDGGTYTLIVTGTGTTQCSFNTSVTGTDSGTVNYRFKPANAARTASSYTVYTFLRSGGEVLVSWSSGF